jgi:glycosyltransferase involved in cell wall biosynthesis
VRGLPTTEDTGTSKLFRTATWTTACSRDVLAGLHEILPDIVDRSSIILSSMPAAAEPPSPLPEGPPVILLLGRLVHDKGFDVALEAYARTLAKVSDSRLVVAGDGPELAALKQQAHQLGLGDHIEFLGEVSRDAVPALIDRSRFMVVPSRYEEGFGLVSIEGAQRGRPVIASRVCGLIDTVKHEETGLHVPMNEVEALSEAMLRLLENPAFAQRLGSAALQRANTEFAWPNYVGSYEALYLRLVEEGA